MQKLIKCLLLTLLFYAHIYTIPTYIYYAYTNIVTVLKRHVFTDAYPAHSGESFCSSDISLDGSTNFDHLDEGTSDTLSLQHLDIQSAHQQNHDGLPSSGIANPIDKLYLMQNSYFSTEQ